MNGYIKLHRDIMDHWISHQGPADYRHAWEDLLMLANHEGAKRFYRGTLTTFKRGTVSRSIGELASLWGWGVKKTRRFLDLLQGDGMIERSSGPWGTVITINNYDKWQGTTKSTTSSAEKSTKTANGETADGLTDDPIDGPTDGLIDGPQTRMIKNDKNEKKDSTPPTPPAGGRKKMRRLDVDDGDEDEYTAILKKQLEEEMI